MRHGHYLRIAAGVMMAWTCCAATRVDILVDFEAGSSGDTFTAEMLNSCTYGTGLASWTKPNTFGVDFISSTSAEYDAPWPVVVNSTSRWDYGHTRGLRIDCDIDEHYFAADFTANRTNVSFGFYFMHELRGETFQQIDLLQVVGASGDFFVPMIRDNPPASGGQYMAAHSGAGIGAVHIETTTNVWYWVTGRKVRNGTCSLAVFNATTLEQVGSTSTIAHGDQNSSEFFFGRTDGHGDGPSRHIHWDDLVIDWTTASFPLMPSNNVYYVRLDGSDSNNGHTNTAGGAFQTIIKAAATAGPGDVVRMQAGAYAHRVTNTVDGLSGARIAFVADGGVTNRGWFINGADNIDIVGNVVSQEAEVGTLGYDGYRITQASNVRLLGGSNSTGRIQFTDSENIEFDRGTNVIVRGLTMIYPDYDVEPDMDLANIASTFAQHSTRIYIEYNQLSLSGDYVLPAGAEWYVRNNRIGPDNGSAVPHIDGIQPNNATSNSVFEMTLSYENQSSHNHLFLNQLEASDGWIIRGSLTVRSKGYLDFSQADKHHLYHNTFVSNFAYYSSSVQVFENVGSGTSIDNLSRNNIWYRSVNPSSTTLYQSSLAIDDDFEVFIGIGDQGQANDLTTDPLFISMGGDDYRLGPSSTSIDSAGAITLANGASGGSSTSLTMDHPAFMPGDWISVGGTVVKISSANFLTTNYTLATAISWSDNAEIRWVTPQGVTINDRGALETGADASTRAATLTVSGNTNTVAVGFPWRLIEVYEDGIPQADIVAPDTASYTKQFGGAVIMIVRPFFVSQPNESLGVLATGVLATGNTTVTVSGPGKSFAKPVYGN